MIYFTHYFECLIYSTSEKITYTTALWFLILYNVIDFPIFYYIYLHIFFPSYFLVLWCLCRRFCLSINIYIYLSFFFIIILFFIRLRCSFFIVSFFLIIHLFILKLQLACLNYKKLITYLVYVNLYIKQKKLILKLKMLLI